MEVHHHSHTADPDSHRGRKKWTHYFWEFLMLFLAVFCGFLAEYQLEHKIEKDREKQYMQSLVYDLQNDIYNLNDGFPLKDKRIEAIDSVFIYFEANPDNEVVPGYVIRQMRRSLWDRHYRRNSTTIDQLKNAGGLRLIRKSIVRDSIAAYDLQWQRADFWVERYKELQEKGKDFLHHIIDAKSAISEYRKHGGLVVTYDYDDSAHVSIHPSPLNQFINFLNDQKITTTQDKRGYMSLEQSAVRLVAIIKKEYHLK